MRLEARMIAKACVTAALALFLASCVSMGTTTGIETGDYGEPPRADGPIPPEFTAFVEELRPAAERAGVSKRVFDAAFAGIGPDPDVLARASAQPEFTKFIWEYLDSSASDRRIADGQAMMAKYRSLLADLEARYGVPATIIVAIWGKESTYGQVLGDPKVVKNAVRSLATLAWKGGKRAGYRAHPADRRPENPAERRRRQSPCHGLLGRCHGPHAVHSDHLSRLCGRLRRRRPPQHLDLGAGCAGLDRELSPACRLAAGPDLGLRGRSPGRL